MYINYKDGPLYFIINYGLHQGLQKVQEACWQYRKPFHLVSTHRSISNFYIPVMTLPQTTWRVKRTSRKCWLIPAAHIHWPLSLCTSDGQTYDRDFLSIPVACDFLKNVVFPTSQLDFDIKTESVQDLIRNKDLFPKKSNTNWTLIHYVWKQNCLKLTFFLDINWRQVVRHSLCIYYM